MRRVAVVLVAVMVATTLVLFAASALAAPEPRSFEVSPTTARSLEVVKTWGSGCKSGALVRIRLDEMQVGTDKASKKGSFTEFVRIPAKTSTGKHTMSAGCGGRFLGSVKIQVLGVQFNVSPRTVWSHQLVKTWGSGCKKGALVRIRLDDVQIGTDAANKKGEFTEFVRIPATTSSGKHRISASCGGRFLGSKTIKVKKVTFNVSPRRVEAGDTVNVFGSGCPSNAHVVIKLDGKVVGHDTANKKGRFSDTIKIPGGTKPGRHVVSAFCNGRFIGSRSIQVVEAYPARNDLVSVSRSAVPAGQAVTVSGSDCPSKAPAASLDGQPVALNVDKAAKGKGFTATATIPAEAAPGKHRLWAACDAGSAGTTELNVLDPAATESAASRQAFGPRPSNDLAIWAGLLAGIALLAASALVGRRRRS